MPHRRQSTKEFLASFRRVRSVQDPVASEVWTFKDGKGRKRRAEIVVGRPQPVPGDINDDWFCAVYIDGWTSHVHPAMGIGPLDSLMNALTLVRSFRDYVGDMHIHRDRGAGT